MKKWLLEVRTALNEALAAVAAKKLVVAGLIVIGGVVMASRLDGDAWVVTQGQIIAEGQRHDLEPGDVKISGSWTNPLRKWLFGTMAFKMEGAPGGPVVFVVDAAEHGESNLLPATAWCGDHEGCLGRVGSVELLGANVMRFVASAKQGKNSWHFEAVTLEQFVETYRQVMVDASPRDWESEDQRMRVWRVDAGSVAHQFGLRYLTTVYNVEAEAVSEHSWKGNLYQVADQSQGQRQVGRVLLHKTVGYGVYVIGFSNNGDMLFEAEMPHRGLRANWERKRD